MNKDNLFIEINILDYHIIYLIVTVYICNNKCLQHKCYRFKFRLYFRSVIPHMLDMSLACITSALRSDNKSSLTRINNKKSDFYHLIIN